VLHGVQELVEGCAGPLDVAPRVRALGRSFERRRNNFKTLAVLIIIIVFIIVVFVVIDFFDLFR
jgi:hypothetical protein